MAYRIELRPSAFRELAKLERPAQERIAARINSLIREPRPHGASKLKGHENRYRVRSGDYRIIYEVRDDVLLILILRIRHRREAYR
jgi:mRNA interferase RelE/StbE